MNCEVWISLKCKHRSRQISHSVSHSSYKLCVYALVDILIRIIATGIHDAYFYQSSSTL